eukprot:TRINITY_DN37693_c0_g1_i1.p1 TRINITY_DN37693_c0_g1~~TRINITY_DN37693_c0_g1_i1.p1  ORF type:complete len:156 (+),score=24.41 TRINITY_DN37693_c0_g1_i1:47-514(+)
MGLDGPLRTQVGKKTWIQPRWKTSQHSNTSRGVAFILGSKFASEKDVVGVWELWCSCTGQGPCRKSEKLMLMTDYFPPRPSSHKMPQPYRATCKLAADLLNMVLQQAPGCCTPFVYADVNDGMGLQKVEQGWAYTPTCVIGAQNSRQGAPKRWSW